MNKGSMGQVLQSLGPPRNKPLNLPPPKEAVLEIPMGNGQPPIYVTEAEFKAMGGRRVTAPDGTIHHQTARCRDEHGQFVYRREDIGEGAIAILEEERRISEVCRRGEEARQRQRPSSRIPGFD